MPRIRRMKQVPVTAVSSVLSNIDCDEQFVVTRRGKPIALTLVMNARQQDPKRVKAAFARLRRLADQTPECRFSQGITAQIRRDRDKDKL